MTGRKQFGNALRPCRRRIALPETLAAVRNARADRMPMSFNLGFGSAMASVGLTIPVIALASISIDTALVLDLGPLQTVLLALSVVVAALTVLPGRATLQEAGVHLVLLRVLRVPGVRALIQAGGRMYGVAHVHSWVAACACPDGCRPSSSCSRRRRWRCGAGRAAGVAKPRLVKNIATGETGWFSSPSLADLDGDRRLEIVAPFYSTFAFSAEGRLLGKATASAGRVYAPSVVADLDRDGGARSWWAATRGRSPRTASGAAAAGRARLARVDLQRRPVPGDPRAGRRRPRRGRP